MRGVGGFITLHKKTEEGWDEFLVRPGAINAIIETDGCTTIEFGGFWYLLLENTEKIERLMRGCAV